MNHLLLIAAVQNPEFGELLLQFALAAAIAFALFALLLSFYRFQIITGELKMPEKMEAPGETALPQGANRFQIEALRMMGIRGRPSPFAAFYASIQTDQPSLHPELPELFAAATRAHLRSTDKIHQLEDGSLGILAPECAPAHTLPLATRLHKNLLNQLFKTASGWSGHLPVRLGVASYPETASTLADLMDALQQAHMSANPAGNPVVLADPPKPAEEDEEDAPEEEPDEDAAHEEEEPIDTSLVDPLTGIMRAARIGAAMQKYMATYRRAGQPVSLMHIEIDNLQRYISQYGQPAQDALLRETGLVLQHQTRINDLPGRFAETEFVVMLPCPLDRALDIARRLCVAVRSGTIRHENRTLKMTIAIGVAAFPEHGRTPRELFVQARTALHAAQNRGGNCALVYEKVLRKEEKQHDKTIDRF